MRAQLLPAAFAVLVGIAFPQTTIMPGAEHAWGENIGWLNMRGDDASGVRVHQNYLSGSAWGENIGWVSFGDGPDGGNAYSQAAGDTGVNRNPLTGALSGFAWSENAGWINFDTSGAGGSQVVIDLAGVFHGFAWGENIGWVSFENGGGSGVGPVQAVVVPNSGMVDWQMY